MPKNKQNNKEHLYKNKQKMAHVCDIGPYHVKTTS